MGTDSVGPLVEHLESIAKDPKHAFTHWDKADVVELCKLARSLADSSKELSDG